ncbi:MAG TPA: barstar family protein [Terriglobia bacterium]|nr:barstar family protein [Terriglobia bacterium]
MAHFTNRQEDWQRRDWQMLREGGISLYRRNEYLADDMQWLAGQNYTIYEFDCGRWNSEDEMYSEFERVMRFSEWWGPTWGHNMDAFEDCLSDLPIRKDGGAVLVLRRFNIYASGAGSALGHNGLTKADILLDVLVRACRFFLLTGRRLITLVHTENPDIQFGPLGAVSPAWNRREWLIKNR